MSANTTVLFTGVYRCAYIFDRYSVQSASTAVLFTDVRVRIFDRYSVQMTGSLQAPLSCLQVCMYI